LKKNNGGQNEISLALREADDLAAAQNALEEKIKKLKGKELAEEE